MVELPISNRIRESQIQRKKIGLIVHNWHNCLICRIVKRKKIIGRICKIGRIGKKKKIIGGIGKIGQIVRIGNGPNLQYSR